MEEDEDTAMALPEWVELEYKVDYFVVFLADFTRIRNTAYANPRRTKIAYPFHQPV
jgi:hypothetical protein